MSSKQLLRLAAVLLAVLVLWGAVALASRRTDDGSSRGIVPKVDTAAIDSVALTGPDGSTLVRRGPRRAGWQVNGHAADSQAVRELLKALSDAKTSAELVARNPQSHERLRVTEASGRRVRVMGQGRVLMDVLVGKQASDGEGVYLRRATQPDVYVIRGELSTALARPDDQWRDRTIAKVTPDSVASIEISRGKRGYTLRRSAGRWTFGSGAAVDSAAVANLLSSYRTIEAGGFATKRQQDSLRFDRTRRTARLLDRGGRPLLSLVFDSIGSGLWVRAMRGNQAPSEAYRLDPWVADQLTPPDSTLRKR